MWNLEEPQRKKSFSNCNFNEIFPTSVDHSDNVGNER